MNLIQKVGAWIFSLDGNSTSLHTPLDPDLIERDTIVNAMSRKLQSQDAQLSKIDAQSKLKSELDDQLFRDQEQILNLQQQEIDKKKEKFEGSLGFDELQKMLSKTKFRDRIVIADRNGEVIFGRFGRFLFLPNGWLGLQERDSGKIISYGQNMDQVIYKPESLRNQLMTGMLRLPCDKNFKFYPDIEKVMVPEPLFDEETGQIKWAEMREAPLLEMVQRLKQESMDKDGYIEQLEADKIGLVSHLNDVKRALGIHKKTAEVAQTETSKAVGATMQYQTSIGDLQRRVVHLQEMKTINDKLISGYEEINQKLLDKMEEVGDKTKFREVLGTVQGLIEWSKENIGETIIEKQEVVEVKEKDKDNKSDNIPDK